jgi:2-polyprenyl-6-methoxyphenol hydroxylase-like FAD-dependent oxidoreductase
LFNALTGVQAVVVGAGPVGLRAAIEFAVRGGDVSMVEKRNSFPRLNILHLWDWACDDLADLGQVFRFFHSTLPSQPLCLVQMT